MPQKHTTPTIIYSQEKAARILDERLSPRTMERWRRKGTGPRFVRIGRRVGYTLEALQEFVANQTRSHTTEGR